MNLTTKKFWQLLENSLVTWFVSKKNVSVESWSHHWYVIFQNGGNKLCWIQHDRKYSYIIDGNDQ